MLCSVVPIAARSGERVHRCRTYLWPALVAAFVGCAPSGEEVVYRLEYLGADTLPAVLQEETDCRHLLRGGEVVFSGRGDYVSTFRIEKRCASEPPSMMPDPGTAGSVRISGDTAYFSNEAGDPAGQGILTADTLVVRSPMRVLRYVRQYGDTAGG